MAFCKLSDPPKTPEPKAKGFFVGQTRLGVKVKRRMPEWDYIVNVESEVRILLAGSIRQ
jgi:hypothetical protein